MKLFTLLLLFSCSLFSQENDKTKNLFKKFDSIVQIKNTQLSYGKLYLEKYRTQEDNHPYFEVNQFIIGDVRYQNQDFFDIKLKYNLIDDELIANLDSDFENYSILLEKAFVEKFNLNGKVFYYTENYGYLELLSKFDEITFFKKNIKNKQKKEDKSFVYYKFSEKNQHFLKYNSKYYKISSKKDLFAILPNQKKSIATFYKANKKILKENIDLFYQLLSKKISKNLQSNQL